MDKAEIEYEKAPLGRRWLSIFVDLFIWIFSAAVLFSLSNMALRQAPAYASVINSRISVEASSKLYTSNGTLVIDYVNSDSSFASYQDKKDYLASSLDGFYDSSAFFEINSDAKSKYEERKSEAKDSSGQNLFSLQSGKLQESNLEPKVFYDFYCTEINDFALTYLFNSSAYANAVRIVTLSLIGLGLACLSLFYFVYFLIFPLTFLKRGRQSLGMKIFKLSYVELNAMNIKTGKFVGRFFFSFFIMFLLDLASFLIPGVVSAGMMFLSKTGQNLTDYVFNDYMVDSSNEDVYLDYSEYLQKKDRRKQTTLENRDLTLK
jgi:uncharacterized RDD family membrane protein YckC